jgi:hypothetical protein
LVLLAIGVLPCVHSRGERAEVVDRFGGAAFGGLVGGEHAPSFEQVVRLQLRAADRADDRAERREREREDARRILAAQGRDDRDGRVLRES